MKDNGNSEDLRELAGSVYKELSQSLDDIGKHIGEDSVAGALARGKLFGLANYTDEAIESYEHGQALAPAEHEASARLALMQIKDNRDEDALQTATLLAAKAPDYKMKEMTSNDVVSVFTILGNTMVKNGKIEEAIEAYQQAQQVAPEDSASSARLAQMHLAKGRPKEALKLKENFSSNPRFRKFSSILNLGERNDVLLPVLDANRLSQVLHLDAHGRPLVIDGEIRLAAVHKDDSSWC